MYLKFFEHNFDNMQLYYNCSYAVKSEKNDEEIPCIPVDIEPIEKIKEEEEKGFKNKKLLSISNVYKYVFDWSSKNQDQIRNILHWAFCHHNYTIIFTYLVYEFEKNPSIDKAIYIYFAFIKKNSTFWLNFDDNEDKEKLDELRKKIRVLIKKPIVSIKNEENKKPASVLKKVVDKISLLINKNINKNNIKYEDKWCRNLKKCTSNIELINIDPSFFNDIIDCIISDYKEDAKLFTELGNPNIKLNKSKNEEIPGDSLHKNEFNVIKNNAIKLTKKRLSNYQENAITNEIIFKHEIKAIGFPDLNQFDPLEPSDLTVF